MLVSMLSPAGPQGRVDVDARKYGEQRRLVPGTAGGRSRRAGGRREQRFLSPRRRRKRVPFSDLNPDSHSFLKARPATRRERTAAAAYTDAGGHDTRDLSGIRSRPGLKASRRTTFQEKRRCPK